jgi:hypothetical protein
MLLALLWSTLPISKEAPPSLASLAGLPPAVVGEVVLKRRKHSIIESVTPDRGLDPPGVVRLKLTERLSSISGGCFRRQWTASFRHEPGTAEASAILYDAFAATEVALPTASGCANGEFVHVNPGLDNAKALSALRHLRNVRSGKAKVRFSCSDSTGSGLCRTPRTIRRELAMLPAWAVTLRNGDIEFWLGKSGQVVTAISYSATLPGHVTVERRIPAPF